MRKMKKTISLLLPLVAIALGLLACKQKQAVRDDILKAESMVDSVPRQAYELLTAHDFSSGFLSEAERMKFLLIRQKAEDKLFMLHDNDSVMAIVADYYEKHGSAEEQTEAYYLLGGVYRDMHDAPKAIDCYTKAMMIGEEHPEETRRNTLSRVYGQLYWMLVHQMNTKQAVEVTRKKSRLYDDHDYWSLHELGTAFQKNLQYDSAGYYLRAALQALDEASIRDTMELTGIYGSDLIQGFKMKDTALIKESHARLKGFSISRMNSMALNAMSYYYEGANDDSALVCLLAAYKKETKTGSKLSVLTRLSHLYHRRGDAATAMRYALERDSLYEKYEQEQQMQQSSNAFNYYVYARDIRQEQQTMEARLRAEKNFYVLLAAFLLCGIVVAVLLRRLRRERRMLRQRTDMLASDCDELREKLQHHISLRTRISREQLCTKLHELAADTEREESLPQDLLSEIVEAISAEYPELTAALEHCVPPLRRTDRIFLYLHKLGISNGEIARLMGCSRSTIGRRLSVLPKNLLDDTAVHDAP